MRESFVWTRAFCTEFNTQSADTQDDSVAWESVFGMGISIPGYAILKRNV